MTQAMPRQRWCLCVSVKVGVQVVKVGVLYNQVLNFWILRGHCLAKLFEENRQFFESVPFCLYQLPAFRYAFLPICHTGVAFVLRVSCVILTLAVVAVLVVV